jgi:hypothetical protein
MSEYSLSKPKSHRIQEFVHLSEAIESSYWVLVVRTILKGRGNEASCLAISSCLAERIAWFVKG